MSAAVTGDRPGPDTGPATVKTVYGSRSFWARHDCPACSCDPCCDECDGVAVVDESTEGSGGAR